MRGRTGWSEREVALLRTNLAGRGEAPLRRVFEDTAEALGRKTNSVRNYYYANLCPAAGKGKRAFTCFTPGEEETLLLYFLRGYAQGKSIRALARELGGGDEKLLLRYQNKYRALVRTRPALVQRLREQLLAEGLQGRGLCEVQVSLQAQIEAALEAAVAALQQARRAARE